MITETSTKIRPECLTVASGAKYLYKIATHTLQFILQPYSLVTRALPHEPRDFSPRKIYW